jgi:hypothetical protein
MFDSRERPECWIRYWKRLSMAKFNTNSNSCMYKEMITMVYNTSGMEIDPCQGVWMMVVHGDHLDQEVCKVVDLKEARSGLC